MIVLVKSFNIKATNYKKNCNFGRVMNIKRLRYFIFLVIKYL